MTWRAFRFLLPSRDIGYCSTSINSQTSRIFPVETDRSDKPSCLIDSYSDIRLNKTAIMVYVQLTKLLIKIHYANYERMETTFDPKVRGIQSYTYSSNMILETNCKWNMICQRKKANPALMVSLYLFI